MTLLCDVMQYEHIIILCMALAFLREPLVYVLPFNATYCVGMKTYKVGIWQCVQTWCCTKGKWRRETRKFQNNHVIYVMVRSRIGNMLVCAVHAMPYINQPLYLLSRTQHLVLFLVS